MPITTKNIFIAILVAIAWVALIMYVAFTKEFDSFQFGICRFETAGKILFLTVIIFLFDILLTEVAITASPVEVIKRHYLQSLVLVIVNMLILYCTINFSMNSMVAILLISVFMGIMKGICVFQAIVNRFNNNSLVKLSEINYA